MISILRQRVVKHFLQKSLNVKRALNLKSTRTELYFGYGANLSVDRFINKNMDAKERGQRYGASSMKLIFIR